MKKFWNVFSRTVRREGKSSVRRAYLIGRIVFQDLDYASTQRAKWIGHMNNVYRVYIAPDTKRADVLCLGIDSIDSEAEGTYKDSSQLPVWMQERLAILCMMKVDPPQTKVEGVGMRIDEDTYWIIKS